MEDKDLSLARGIAQGAHQSPVMTDMARKGLITTARAKASIEAYEFAIKTIEERTTKPA